MGETIVTTSYQPGDVTYPDAHPDDLDLLADRRFTPTRFTVMLVILIGVALAFGGGVLVQKHYGTSGSAAATGFPGAPAGGFGQRTGGTAGGYGGFGEAAGAPPGAAGTAAGGGPAGTSSNGTAPSGSSASSTPVVVGTITRIAGSTLTVKNFAGKSVRVTVPEGASITLVAGSTLTGLATGATVSVAGTAASDGSVRATAVTVRRA